MNVLLLLFFVLLAQGLLFGLRYALRNVRSIWLRIAIFVVKAVLVPVAALAVIFFNAQIFWRSTFLSCGLYIALFCDVIADILAAVCRLFTKKRMLTATGIISAVLSIVLMGAGAWNVAHITSNEFVFPSDKLNRDYTVIFVSDTHVGSAQSFSTLEKMVEDMKQVQPDCIILGGDIVDEYTTREEMQETFALFGSTGIPTYFVYGNHDRQAMANYANGRQFSEADLEAAIEQSGVTILQEEFVQLAEDLVLLGREDAGMPERRVDSSTLISPVPGAFLLCADHNPYMTQDIEAVKADLQISGHSHAGQLFPCQALYNLAGFDAYGVYERFDTVLYVSSGAGSWQVPFRSEERCVFDVIRLVPAE